MAKKKSTVNLRPYDGSLTARETQLISDIRAVLTPDLLHKSYLKRWTPRRTKDWGHCYAASEALYHLLGGKIAGYAPHQVFIDGESHWFLKTGDIILDPTPDQFAANPSAMLIKIISRAAGFLTKEPCKRAQEIIRRVKKMRAVLNKYRTVR